jgi:fluoride exporter
MIAGCIMLGGHWRSMQRFLPYLLVGAGSFIGGNARYLVSRWVGGLVGARFPLATFLINVAGSFVLGFIAGLLASRSVAHSDAIRLALGVGFCGGFTTFSAFEFETYALLEDGVWLTAFANVFASLFAGFIAVRLGVLAGRAWS